MKRKREIERDEDQKQSTDRYIDRQTDRKCDICGQLCSLSNNNLKLQISFEILQIKCLYQQQPN